MNVIYPLYLLYVDYRNTDILVTLLNFNNKIIKTVMKDAEY